MSASALVCDGVRVSYRQGEVLCGIDLELSGGEWLGVIGPNGAGKSTLLRSIAGLVDFHGTVRLGASANGASTNSASANSANTNSESRTPNAMDVAMVPQSPILPPGMTVAEYVLLGRTAHLGWLAQESHADREIASAVLHRLDLTAFAHRLVSTLSGGEAQRVVVARALAQQSPVLLLDEPTTALDVGHQVAVLELVDDLRRTEGLSVLAAMHDLSAAARFADRLMLMDHGRIVAQGRPAEVLDAELLSAVYATPLTVQSIDHELVVLPASRPRGPQASMSATPMLQAQ